jgi:hypothetical protein
MRMPQIRLHGEMSLDEDRADPSVFLSFPQWCDRLHCMRCYCNEYCEFAQSRSDASMKAGRHKYVRECQYIQTTL